MFKDPEGQEMLESDGLTRMLNINKSRPDKDMTHSVTHALPNTF